MKIKSFAYLKGQQKNNLPGKPGEQLPRAMGKPPSMETKKEICVVGENRADGERCFAGVLPDKVKTQQIFDRLDPLLDSGWCYGCLDFSIDSPCTARQVGWCMRRVATDGAGHGENQDGKEKISDDSFEFKIIRPQYLIKDCPRVKNGTAHREI